MKSLLCSPSQPADRPRAARAHVEQAGVQLPVGVAGQVDHRGDRPFVLPEPAGSPNVLVHAEGLHPAQPSGPARTGSGFGLDRPPQRVPADPQMPRQRGDGRVVMGQRISRPDDRAATQHRPRADQLVFLRPRQLRAVGLAAAPDPLQPDDQHRQPEARRIGRLDAAPAVPDRHDTAGRAAAHVGVGLDGAHQLAVATLHIEYVHAIAVEHRIGPGTPARTRTTPIVVHVGVFFSWQLGRYRS